MRIDQYFQQKETTLSFEVFPPKAGTPFEPCSEAVKALAAYRPDFMSVTYGAGGGTSQNTAAIAELVEQQGVTALAHLSCVSSTKEEIIATLAQLRRKGVHNVLALRGDIPEDVDFPDGCDYRYAYELIDEIHETGDFCVGAACYPEGHVECENKSMDLEHLKQKVEHGVDFLVTQMFFDNSLLYSFLYRALAKGIDVPVIAGVMPVTNVKQISRICSLSGTSLTPKFRMILDKFGDKPQALRQAGIAYAVDQIVDLAANGVQGIHIYTMNKPEIAEKILASIAEIF